MAQGAPPGNNFWTLRSKHGRDKLFATPDLMWEACEEYFLWCIENPIMETDFRGKDADEVQIPKMRAFTMQGLCRYIGCNTVYFNHFEKTCKEKGNDLSKDFGQIILRVRETVYEQKFTGAAAGFLNANLISRELGIADKQETRPVDKDGNDVIPSPAINITMHTAGAAIPEIEE